MTHVRGRTGWSVVAIAALALSACASPASPSAPTDTVAPTDQASSAVYGGCADRPLKESLAAWAGTSGGVWRAHVRLTGQTTQTEDGVYSELEIVDPRPIAGKAVDLRTGWVAGGTGPDGTVRLTRGSEGALWAPDGTAVVVADPAQALTGDPSHVELRLAPVVGDDVVLSNAGCWNDSTLHTGPFTGGLAEVPGTQTADAVRPSLQALPYASFVTVAKQALHAR